jgi:hypothetical protein
MTTRDEERQDTDQSNNEKNNKENEKALVGRWQNVTSQPPPSREMELEVMISTEETTTDTSPNSTKRPPPLWVYGLLTLALLAVSSAASAFKALRAPFLLVSALIPPTVKVTPCPPTNRRPLGDLGPQVYSSSLLVVGRAGS